MKKIGTDAAMSLPPEYLANLDKTQLATLPQHRTRLLIITTRLMLKNPVYIEGLKAEEYLIMATIKEQALPYPCLLREQ